MWDPQGPTSVCARRTNFSGQCYLWLSFSPHSKRSIRTLMSCSLTRLAHDVKTSTKISGIHLSRQSQNASTPVSYFPADSSLEPKSSFEINSISLSADKRRRNLHLGMPTGRYIAALIRSAFKCNPSGQSGCIIMMLLIISEDTLKSMIDLTQTASNKNV